MHVVLKKLSSSGTLIDGMRKLRVTWDTRVADEVGRKMFKHGQSQSYVVSKSLTGQRL